MPTISIDQVNLYYEVYGKGTPIIFIHPPLLTSTNFLYQIGGLSNFFQVIVFDIRGHGNSSISDETLTYPLISNDIKQILDYLEIDKSYLCGYSTGGSIVLDFLLTYPERAFGGILIGAMSEVNDWMLKRRISLAAMIAKTKVLDTLAFYICLGNSNNKNVFSKLYHDAKKGNIKNIEQYYRYSMTFNCTSRLAEINAPVLSIYGEKDKGFHHYAHLINQNLRNNELVFIKKGKHQIPTKSYEEVNTLIKNFVSKHER